MKIREILHHYIGYNLSEHQIVTIIRAFQSRDALNPSLPTENLYSILQTELKRINFQFFDQLEMNLKEKDVNETGMLSKELLRINLISGFLDSWIFLASSIPFLKYVPSYLRSAFLPVSTPAMPSFLSLFGCTLESHHCWQSPFILQ